MNFLKIEEAENEYTEIQFTEKSFKIRRFCGMWAVESGSHSPETWDLEYFQTISQVFKKYPVLMEYF